MPLQSIEMISEDLNLHFFENPNMPNSLILQQVILTMSLAQDLNGFPGAVPLVPTTPYTAFQIIMQVCFCDHSAIFLHIPTCIIYNISEDELLFNESEVLLKEVSRKNGCSELLCKYFILFFHPNWTRK